MGNRTTEKRPTYYTMTTSFNQNRKYYNQNNKNPSSRFTHGTPGCSTDLFRFLHVVNYPRIDQEGS